MTEQFAFRLPLLPNGSDPARQVLAMLIGLGLSPADASRLVDTELTITPSSGIKRLTELLEGRHGDGGVWIGSSEECKTAGGKLVACLLWDGVSRPQPDALTEKERELVVERGFDVKVRAGFNDRVTSYTSSTDQLAAVLKLFSPTVIRGDRNSDKTRRLVAAAAEILGVGAAWSEAE